MKQPVTNWSGTRYRAEEWKHHWLLFSQSGLPSPTCFSDRKLKRSHNQSTPPFHHPSPFTLSNHPSTHLGALVDARNQFPSLSPCIVRCWFRRANKRTHKAEPICYSVRILEVRERAAPVKLSVSFMPGGVNKGSGPQGYGGWWWRWCWGCGGEWCRYDETEGHRIRLYIMAGWPLK